MKPINDLKQIRHGDHACLLYRSLDEQKSVLSAFFKEGLGRGELCVYIVDEQLDPELVNLLAAEGVDMLRLRQDGSLQLLSRYQTFLRYARFEPALMIEFLERLLVQARDQNFTGLRVATEMSWALTIGCDQLLGFEALLSEHIIPWRLTMLCQYQIDRFAPGILQDALRTHSIALLGEQVCPNFYCEPPSLVLNEPNVEARVEWMMEMLKKASPLICKR